MAKDQLATYLNDHLSGSVVALELLEHLQKGNPDQGMGSFLIHLQTEIKADRQVLEDLMKGLNMTCSQPRQLAAWLTEKALRFKLWVDEQQQGAFRELEALECISLGIEGKRLLWKTLDTLKSTYPDCLTQDFNSLAARALQQRDELEEFRMLSARRALENSNDG